jgi:hypothetical protein
MHFNLDGVDLKQALGKVGEHANKTTSQELRFLKENWSSFKNNVIFYKNGSKVSSPF